MRFFPLMSPSWLRTKMAHISYTRDWAPRGRAEKGRTAPADFPPPRGRLEEPGRAWVSGKASVLQARRPSAAALSQARVRA